MKALRREIVFGRGLVALAIIAALSFLIYEMRGILTPLFLAFIIAYVFDPVVDWFERRRLPRAVGIVIVVLLVFGGVAAFVALVVPDIVADIRNVTKALPTKVEALGKRLEPLAARAGVELPHTGGEWVATIQQHAGTLTGKVAEPAAAILGWLVGGTASVVGAIIGALIVPIFAVYLLYDFDNITAGAADLIPHRYRSAAKSYATEIDKLLSQFMRGQVMVMAILAVLYGGAYAILGVKLAWPIGIAAGILNFVPYIGGVFALLAGLVMALLGGGGWTQIIGVVVAYSIIQALEGFVITPKIVGKSVGLSEIWVMVALFVGGELFGFLGVLLAVPLAVVVKVFVSRSVAHYRSSALFLQGAPEGAVGAVTAAESAPPSEPDSEDEEIASADEDSSPADSSETEENSSPAD